MHARRRIQAPTYAGQSPARNGLSRGSPAPIQAAPRTDELGRKVVRPITCPVFSPQPARILRSRWIGGRPTQLDRLAGSQRGQHRRPAAPSTNGTVLITGSFIALPLRSPPLRKRLFVCTNGAAPRSTWLAQTGPALPDGFCHPSVRDLKRTGQTARRRRMLGESNNGTDRCC